MLRFLYSSIAGLLLPAATLSAGDIYYTGFDSPFIVGDDKIAGTDGWTAPASNTGLKLSGVDAETDHLVSGLGNAAFIGGNATVLSPSVSATVNVRKTFTPTLTASDAAQEVVLFQVLFGIKDSTAAGLLTRRDNFEFAFYNSSGVLIGFIQFDNSTLDLQTQAPAQKIWRSTYTTSLTKLDTGSTFYYDVMQHLQVRINLRTNRWTASLDGLDIFSDQPFYTGSNPRNIGTIAVQMQVVNSAVYSTFPMFQTGRAPGDNYMLFDDFALRADPVPAPVIYTLTHPAGGNSQLTWSTEALYKYQVQYTDDLTQAWKSDLPNSLVTANTTGESSAFTDTTASDKSRRYYRIQRTAPP